MKTSTIIGIVVTILIATACTTSETVAPTPETASPVKTDSARISRGMTQEEVLKILGEPEKKEVASTADATLEIWHYAFVVGQTTEMVQTDTRMTHYSDPVTGVERDIPEPVMSPQTTVIKQTIQLMFENGLVVTWKNQTVKKVNYHY